MKCILGFVVLVTFSVWAEEEVAQALTASQRLARANRDVVRSPDEPYVEDDIAYDSEFQRNADPRTSTGCMWPKSSDGKVYVPYTISSVYSSREVATIERGLFSFHDVSCICFVRHTNERDYLKIQSLSGCYSFLGRHDSGQDLSLQRSGCVYHFTIQHKLLHALGFHHEQTRSDRDQYIRILWDNVTPGSSAVTDIPHLSRLRVNSASHAFTVLQEGACSSNDDCVSSCICLGQEYNFHKVNTLNQETTYDYGSVMHYYKYAFSKNNQPTLVAVPDSNVQFGMATEMSQSDIIRLNRLYGC